MSIKILKKSFAEHRTIDSISVTTNYIMTWDDYYNGIGDLVDCNGDLLVAGFTLPYEGDSFSIYYSTCYLTDCVLTDITMDPTLAPDPFEPNDNTGQDLDYMINVTYTWSNDGANDTKRVNEASSWKIRYKTTMEYLTIENYISTEDDEKHIWADDYFDTIPTEVVLPDDEEGITPDLYSDETDVRRQEWREFAADQVPEIQKRVPTTTCEITAYSSEVKGSVISQLMGTINSADLLGTVYSQKELALIEKNKLPGYDANDWLATDDTGQWLLIDWDMSDLNNGMFEYIFYFEFKKDGWNFYEETIDASPLSVTLSLYDTTNFYDAIFAGMDAVLPNDRGGCR